MGSQVIYQSKGISKKYAISLFVLFVVFEVLGIFFLFKKKYSRVLERGSNVFSEDGAVYAGRISSKSSYVLSGGPRFILAILFIVLGIFILGMIISLSKAKLTLYNDFIEFSECSNKVLFGLSSSKYMKDIRLPYQSIITIKADNMHCQLYISSSDGKQYRVVCKEVEKVKGILEKKVHILV